MLPEIIYIISDVAELEAAVMKLQNRGGATGGAGPALAGPILILSLKKYIYIYIYISFLNPKEVAVS